MTGMAAPCSSVEGVLVPAKVQTIKPDQDTCWQKRNIGPCCRYHSALQAPPYVTIYGCCPFPQVVCVCVTSLGTWSFSLYNTVSLWMYVDAPLQLAFFDVSVLVWCCLNSDISYGHLLAHNSSCTHQTWLLEICPVLYVYFIFTPKVNFVHSWVSDMILAMQILYFTSQWRMTMTRVWNEKNNVRLKCNDFYGDYWSGKNATIVNTSLSERIT